MNAQNKLRAMWPTLEQMLTEVDEKMKSDPNDINLRKKKKELTKMLAWICDDSLKRYVRDAIRKLPSK